MAFARAIYALQATTVANAVLLFAASPIFAALLGRLVLDEPVTRLTSAAIMLALAGVAVMVGGGFAGGGAWTGNLSAFSFAIFTVTLRLGKSGAMLQTVLLGGLFSMATGAVAGLILNQPLRVSLPDAVTAMAMGAVTLTGGMLLYTLGSRVVPAAQATLISLTEVLLAPRWAWLFLSESLMPGTWIGGTILLAAITLNAFTLNARTPNTGSPNAAGPALTP
ncbi:MAG: DMT family transporter [Candidatus Saccharibacteria bacterium]|nr:DMT family transporter [Pseudorhodobacter sp.]